MKMQMVLILVATLVFVTKTNGRPDLREYKSPLEDTYEEDNGAYDRTLERHQKSRHARQIPWYPYPPVSPCEHVEISSQLENIKLQLEMLKMMLLQPKPQPIYMLPDNFVQKYSPNNVTVNSRVFDLVKGIWSSEKQAGADNNITPIQRPTTTPSPTTMTPSPQSSTRPGKEPRICETAILLCCSQDKNVQKSCFESYNCSKTYQTGFACSAKVIENVINIFKNAYAPR